MRNLKEYLIIDGYNIINSWPNLRELKKKSFEHARDKLISILSDLQGVTGTKIIVVFDALNVEGGVESHELVEGIEVIFSHQEETADTVIERLVGQLPSGSIIGVATSDWAEQRIVFGRGAYRLSARDLYERVQNARRHRDKYAFSGFFEPPDVYSNLDDNTKKSLEKLRRSK